MRHSGNCRDKSNGAKNKHNAENDTKPFRGFAFLFSDFRYPFTLAEMEIQMNPDHQKHEESLFYVIHCLVVYCLRR